MNSPSPENSSHRVILIPPIEFPHFDAGLFAKRGESNVIPSSGPLTVDGVLEWASNGFPSTSTPIERPSAADFRIAKLTEVEKSVWLDAVEKVRSRPQIFLSGTPKMEVVPPEDCDGLTPVEALDAAGLFSVSDGKAGSFGPPPDALYDTSKFLDFERTRMAGKTWEPDKGRITSTRYEPATGKVYGRVYGRVNDGPEFFMHQLGEPRPWAQYLAWPLWILMMLIAVAAVVHTVWMLVQP